MSNLYLITILIFFHLFPRHHPGHGTKSGWLDDLLMETSKVYSGFLDDGVLLMNVSSHNFRQGWLLHCQEQAEECVYQQSIFYLVSLIHSFSSIDH